MKVKIEKVTKHNGTTYFTVETEHHVELFFFGGVFVTPEEEAYTKALDYAHKIKNHSKDGAIRELILEL